LLGIKLKRGGLDTISHEELRTIVREASGKTLSSYQKMLLSILDLQKVIVEDIMVPRNEIIGIDIESDWEDILRLLTISQHTRLPIYRETIDQIEGIVHLRRALNLLAQNSLNKQTLLEAAEEPYFVPEGTPLNVQLVNFRKRKRRSALVVDEYGDILGLITLEGILEEIVGEFTTSLAAAARKDIHRQKDGSYLVDGSVTIRELNRIMSWEFPTEGPKTLNGLIVEHLEALPATGIALRLAGYPIEIVEVEENKVKTARIWPKLRIAPEKSLKE
jgi:Mg2+/Co2+ transporter CorB